VHEKLSRTRNPYKGRDQFWCLCLSQWRHCSEPDHGYRRRGREQGASATRPDQRSKPIRVPHHHCWHH